MDAVKIIKKHGSPGGLPVVTAYVDENAPGEAGGGVPIKVIHINLRENTIEEDYDTLLSYFTDDEEGKCIVLVNVGGDGYTPLRLNWEDLGGIWMEINPATGAMLVQSFTFSVDPEEQIVTLSSFGVTYTGTLAG